MRFGSRVIVRRGSNHHAMNLRDVPGVLVGRNGNSMLVKLDYYDGPTDTGLVGGKDNYWFSESQVREYDYVVPMEYLNDPELIKEPA